MPVLAVDGVVCAVMALDSRAGALGLEEGRSGEQKHWRIPAVNGQTAQTPQGPWLERARLGTPNAPKLGPELADRAEPVTGAWLSVPIWEGLGPRIQ